MDGKILPFALLRVNFTRPVPPPGTPLANESGRVVGLVFQPARNPPATSFPPKRCTGCARHLQRQRALIRGWLGLALRGGVAIPADQPGAAGLAGRRGGNHGERRARKIGARTVTDYADAANAFFYLIPGRAGNA